MTRLTIIFCVSIFLFVPLLTGCQTIQQPTQPDQTPLKIGAILPLSGKAADWGKRTKKGIELALEEVNKNQKNIQVLYEDSEADIKRSTSAAKKLTELDKVQVLFSQLSGVSQAVAPIAQENKIVLFGFTSTPGFTQQGDYVFSNRGDATHIGKTLGKFTISQGYRSAAILYLNNETYIGAKNSFIKILEENNHDFIFSDSHEKNEIDYKTSLTKIINLKPDIIFIPSRDKNTAIALVQARELGLDQPIFSFQGVDTQSFFDIAKDKAEGLIFAQTIVYQNTPNPQLQNALKKHQEKHDEPMSLYAANAYDVVRLLGQITEQGHKTSEEIKNALMQVKDFPGVSGDITFDSTGNVDKENKLFIIEKGKSIPYQP